jgi:hypothetical protein
VFLIQFGIAVSSAKVVDDQAMIPLIEINIVIPKNTRNFFFSMPDYIKKSIFDI